MERTIKFKSKRIDNSEWVEGYFLQDSKGKSFIYNPILDRKGFIMSEVAPSSVCQFTGLKDKGGKEIWEHDIVEITYENGFIQKCAVEYFQDAFIGINSGTHIPLCLYGGCDKDILKRVIDEGSKFDRKEGEK